MQALFALDPSEHGRRLFAAQSNGLDGVMEKPHTLEDYAVDHFRPPPKKVRIASVYSENRPRTLMCRSRERDYAT